LEFELKATGADRCTMSRFAGCKRVAYNKGLALQTANYAAGNNHIRYESLAKYVGVWRSDSDSVWLGEAPYHVLQLALKDLD